MPGHTTNPSYPPSIAKRALVVLLRLDALILCAALLAILMPTEWMIWTHRELGLGAFPESTLVSYLTRTVAGLYFLRGVMVGFVSFAVDRYLPIVALLGLGNVAFGIFVTVLDTAVGMPWFWTMGEGPPVALLGCAVLALCWQRGRELSLGSPSDVAAAPVVSKF